MKALARSIISKIPGVRFWLARRTFLGPQRNTQRMLGVFPSSAAAKANIPKSFVQGTDEARLLLDYDQNVRKEDLPVIRILSGLMPGIKTLFDFGGNIGVCFYQYRSLIPYPPELVWMVSDLPSVNEAGRKIARERGETQLVFTDNPLDGNGADFYLTTGTLQYLDEPFADILGRLKDRPRHVLVNRVPLTDKKSFHTLQHSGPIIYPYFIANHAAFVASIEALGYKLAEEWTLDRSCDIILRPAWFVRNYFGLHFVRV
jgi:putative methyltransferase (TIGR04325 family)